MYIVTSCAYDPTTHGSGGPVGHYIVDNVWTPHEFMIGETARRANRHNLRIDIGRLEDVGMYSTCILCTIYIRILQRAFRRRIPNI